MSKKYFNIISVAIVIMIISLSLYGCNNKPKKTATVKPSITSDKVDFQGAQVKILYRNVKQGKGTYPFKNSKGIEAQKMMERIDKIQTDFNCEIMFIGTGNLFPDWENFHSSILRGEPTADFADVGYEYVVQSVEKGGLYTVLNDYADELELDNAELWDQTAVQDMLTIADLTVGIQPVKRGAEQVNAGLVMFFNKSILEREGLWSEYNLYDLQKNKTWTWSKLDEIASKTVKDKDGDGEVDQYGMMFSEYTITGLNASNSEGGIMAGLYGVTKDNEPVLLARQQPQVNAMNFLCQSGRKNKGWLTSPDFNQSERRDYFAAGKCAFIIESGGALAYFNEKKMQDTLGIVAIPIGPDNETKDYFLGRRGCAPWAMASGVQKPRETALVMKEYCAPLYTEEEADIGIETYLSDFIGDESEIIETYKLLDDPERMSYSMDNPFIATWWPSFASYEGNFRALGEDGMTGEALNKLWGDAAQKDMNKYWGMVMEGADGMKEERAKKGLK